MTEIKQIQHYLTSQKFYVDYQYENEQVWVSRHRGETIVADTNTGEFTVEQPFDIDRTFTTLEGIKSELNLKNYGIYRHYKYHIKPIRKKILC